MWRGSNDTFGAFDYSFKALIIEWGGVEAPIDVIVADSSEICSCCCIGRRLEEMT